MTYDLTLEEARTLTEKTAELGKKYVFELIACELTIMDYAGVINYVDAWEILRGDIDNIRSGVYSWFINAASGKRDPINSLFTEEVFEGKVSLEDRINVAFSYLGDDGEMELYDEVLTYIKNNQ